MPCPQEQRGWVKTKALPSSPGLPRRSAAEGTKEEPLAGARRLVRRSVISRAPGEVMLGWERRGCFFKNYYYFFLFLFFNLWFPHFQARLQYAWYENLNRAIINRRRAHQQPCELFPLHEPSSNPDAPRQQHLPKTCLISEEKKKKEIKKNASLTLPYISFELAAAADGLQRGRKNGL